MKAFRYRLAAVLTRARHAERVLQIELARRQEEVIELDRQLDSVTTVMMELRARVRAAVSPPMAVDLAALQSLAQAMEDAEALEQHITALRREAAEHVADARERLLHSARSRRLLENHRQDLADRHRRVELAAETKRLDELGTSAGTSAAKRRSNGEEEK